jgi:hypothetical protein
VAESKIDAPLRKVTVSAGVDQVRVFPHPGRDKDRRQQPFSDCSTSSTPSRQHSWVPGSATDAEVDVAAVGQLAAARAATLCSRVQLTLPPRPVSAYGAALDPLVSGLLRCQRQAR